MDRPKFGYPPKEGGHDDKNPCAKKHGWSTYRVRNEGAHRAGCDGEKSMTLDLARVRVFIRPGITDMRKQIHGLAAIVQDTSLS